MRNQYYGSIQPGDNLNVVSIKKGQVIAGYLIGILLLDVWYPLIPGNVVNASTYDFPVRHKLVTGANQELMHKGDPSLIEEFIKAGKELEMDGVRAIVGACGYMGHFQPQLAEALNVPVYTSSIMQIPWIKAGLKQNQKIGVLCADDKNLTSEILMKCGINNPEVCVVKGLGEKPEFSAILNSDRGSFDNTKVTEEVVMAAQEIVAENDSIGAILLECSDMPPYAAAVQQAVNLPVFDFITMIKWIHGAIAQKPYYGFL